MARTRRRVPHWVRNYEKWEKFMESLGYDPNIGNSKNSHLNLRQQVETGNFDMTCHDAREDEAWRRKKKAEAYNKFIEEDQ